MSESQTAYRVLARKYRPQNFDELIGQDALVRTLTNAIESGRIAHAFMLTGVRGVGKTTTARIIAKALNHSDGPTVGSTDDCEICKAISEDRHPDVIEMDAASRTGVDDIREILDGVRYAPTEARYKVYVIDEVHMLSKNAFNALLKTLEEPPEHVKFIFATTEIRKVPITVLSRCQRFDLRRVDVPTLSAHFAGICEKENVGIEDSALAMIARAADGSVRDGLSILDQAMAMSGQSITVQGVEDMLGLADRARNLDLLEHALSGNMPEALEIMDDLYSNGADPVAIVQDLMELTHALTKFRAVPEAKDSQQGMAPDELERSVSMAGQLSMPSLSKAWQVLLKGLAEVQAAPNPQKAAEMVIIRLTYAADLPDPADLIKTLKEQGADAVSASGASGAGAPSPSPAASSSAHAASQGSIPTGRSAEPAAVMAGVPPSGAMPSGGGERAALAIVPDVEPEEEERIHITQFEHVVAALEQAREVLLASQVYQYVHVVKFQPGRLEMRVAEQAPQRLSQDLGQALSKITGERWVVSVSSAPGEPTLAQRDEAILNAERDEVLAMPIMKEVLSVFPDAKIQTIKHIEQEK